MAEESRKHVLMYTDGACKGNPGPGGYGVVLSFGKHTKELSGGCRNTTNNRMELLACIEGLKALKYPCTVTIHSDSTYVVQAVENNWIRGWMARGWITKAKQPVKNKDLWLEFVGLLSRHSVTMEWVKGHAGHAQNERCDQLATQVASQTGLPADDGFEAMLKNTQEMPLFESIE